MAVLLITYKHDPKNPKQSIRLFEEVIRSYRWVKLSGSNYAITADEQATDVWHKLKAHIDPDDYLVMLTFKSGSWSLKDQKILAWLVEHPLKIEL